MTNYTLYHNPACSKSRAGLELLESRGIKAKVVHYLDNPLTHEELSSLLAKLNINARDLLRSKEDAFDEFGLGNLNLAESQLIEAMVQAPILIERPILATDTRAVIGRPTEKLLELL